MTIKFKFSYFILAASVSLFGSQVAQAQYWGAPAATDKKEEPKDTAKPILDGVRVQETNAANKQAGDQGMVEPTGVSLNHTLAENSTPIGPSRFGLTLGGNWLVDMTGNGQMMAGGDMGVSLDATNVELGLKFSIAKYLGESPVVGAKTVGMGPTLSFNGKVPLVKKAHFYWYPGLEVGYRAMFDSSMPSANPQGLLDSGTPVATSVSRRDLASIGVIPLSLGGDIGRYFNGRFGCGVQVLTNFGSETHPMFTCSVTVMGRIPRNAQKL